MARHGWDVDHCVAILNQCRRLMPDHGKLLVIELVLPEGDKPFFARCWTCTCSYCSVP
jgi:hypothetical protein